MKSGFTLLVRTLNSPEREWIEIITQKEKVMTRTHSQISQQSASMFMDSQAIFVSSAKAVKPEYPSKLGSKMS